MIEFHNGENILLTHRKHWFILVAQLIPLAVIFLLPMFAFIIIRINDNTDFSQFISPYLENATVPLIIFSVGFWTLIFWIKLFSVWTDYFLDVWIVTNKRIIDVEQHGFFRREVSSFRYEQVEDITVEVNGIVANIFDFGNLHVQTAGEARQLIIHGVAKPNILRNFISVQLEQVYNRASPGHFIPTPNASVSTQPDLKSPTNEAL